MSFADPTAVHHETAELLAADLLVTALADDPASTAGGDSRRRRILLFEAVPAWLVSMLSHVVLLLVLGLVSVAEPEQIVNVLSAANVVGESAAIEEFTIEDVEPEELEAVEELPDAIADMTVQMDVSEITPIAPAEMVTVDIDLSDMATEMAPAAELLQSLESVASSPMGGRSVEMRQDLLRKYGGTPTSEAAVTEALKWFARHQMPNGGWTFQHNLVCNNSCGDGCSDAGYQTSYNAATSMALLPFLGAGQTHYHGQFRDVVRDGLLFLINNGKAGKHRGLAVLDFRDRKGNMYSHGLAAITLCEAYAMTEDPALAGPAQAALNFTIFAQGRDGGWRYSPNVVEGDTSAVGWQLMALKSGYMAHLAVPQQVVEGTVMFLDRVQNENGSKYLYVRSKRLSTPGTNAVGLLCRMYTGWDKLHPGIIEGVEYLRDTGVLKNDLYYDYYAVQVLRHYGGAAWEEFNTEMRDWLVNAQDKRPG